MNIVSMPHGLMSISFDTGININNTIYENIVFIVRLLSYGEVNRIYGLNISNPYQDIIIEDEIFDLVLVEVAGFDGEIDRESMEAGIVSTISGAVVTESLNHVYKLAEYVDKYEKEISFIDSMTIVVSRYYNTPLSEVEKIPINKLYKLFATFKTTFPEECRIELEDVEQQ